MTRHQLSTSREFRDVVVDYLASYGLPAAAVQPEVSRESTTKGRSCVIEGLPATVMTRMDVGRMDMSGAVHDAEAHADERGSRVFAAVLPRHGHPHEDSYAVMPLRVLALVLLDLDRADLP